MNYLKLLSAVALLIAAVPFGAANAQGGPGPCTPPVGVAVGAAGPAMTGGQLMAGVGQCAPVGGWHNARRFGFGGVYAQPQIAPPVAQFDYGEYGGSYPY